MGLGLVGALGVGGMSIIGIGTDLGTAMGMAALTALGSARWAVGKWERAKQAWWSDWARVADGVQRDLEVQYSIPSLFTLSSCLMFTEPMTDQSDPNDG
jgi:hypothetical protein